MNSTAEDGNEQGLSQHEGDRLSTAEPPLDRNAAGTAGQTASGSHDTPSGGRRRLPARQPARALMVVLVYLLVVGTGFAGLTARYGRLGLVFAVFLAGPLLVPLAILAPRPRQAGDDDEADPRPVLLRS